VPFENLDKRWKVLKLDNKDIFDKKLNISSYPLVINYWVLVDEEGIKKLITTMLEDYSQPRLTNPEEQQQLLESIFKASKNLEKISF